MYLVLAALILSTSSKMALCCIGGVCIPYTAIIPLLIYGLQWVLQKLANMGLLPESLCKQLQGFMITINNTSKTKEVNDGSCCNATKKTGNATNERRGKQNKEAVTSTSHSSCAAYETMKSVAKIPMIESQEDWDQLVTTSEELSIVCKFTAAWCKPCKEVQPLFESLSSNYVTTAKFVMVDVDVLDDVASMYKVLSLPTFVTLRNGRVIDKYSGSNPEQLKSFIISSLSVGSSEK